MKIAAKPSTTSRPIDFRLTPYSEALRHEKASAQTLSERVHENDRKQRMSARSMRDLKCK